MVENIKVRVDKQTRAVIDQLQEALETQPPWSSDLADAVGRLETALVDLKNNVASVDSLDDVGGEIRRLKNDTASRLTSLERATEAVSSSTKELANDASRTSDSIERLAGATSELIDRAGARPGWSEDLAVTADLSSMAEQLQERSEQQQQRLDELSGQIEGLQNSVRHIVEVTTQEQNELVRLREGQAEMRQALELLVQQVNQAQRDTATLHKAVRRISDDSQAQLVLLKRPWYRRIFGA